MYGLPMYYGAAAKLLEFAKEMREKPTVTEEAMWQIIKANSIKHKFRRQHPISAFIADFYCHELRLVIEIDGGYHLDKEQAIFDNFRDDDMAGFGIYDLLIAMLLADLIISFKNYTIRSPS